MSSLFNPYALTALGKPLQQRQSPELRVETPHISRAQLDMAQHTFVRFLDQARLSRAPNPTQQGRLADGTPYRIVTASGAPIMQVWPVTEASQLRKYEMESGIVLTRTDSIFYVLRYRDGVWIGELMESGYCALSAAQRVAEDGRKVHFVTNRGTHRITGSINPSIVRYSATTVERDHYNSPRGYVWRYPAFVTPGGTFGIGGTNFSSDGNSLIHLSVDLSGSVALYRMTLPEIYSKKPVDLNYVPPFKNFGEPSTSGVINLNGEYLERDVEICRGGKFLLVSKKADLENHDSYEYGWISGVVSPVRFFYQEPLSYMPIPSAYGLPYDISMYCVYPLTNDDGITYNTTRFKNRVTSIKKFEKSYNKYTRFETYPVQGQGFVDIKSQSSIADSGSCKGFGTRVIGVSSTLSGTTHRANYDSEAYQEYTEECKSSAFLSRYADLTGDVHDIYIHTTELVSNTANRNINNATASPNNLLKSADGENGMTTDQKKVVVNVSYPETGGNATLKTIYHYYTKNKSVLKFLKRTGPADGVNLSNVESMADELVISESNIEASREYFKDKPSELKMSGDVLFRKQVGFDPLSGIICFIEFSGEILSCRPTGIDYVNLTVEVDMDVRFVIYRRSQRIFSKNLERIEKYTTFVGVRVLNEPWEADIEVKVNLSPIVPMRLGEAALQVVSEDVEIFTHGNCRDETRTYKVHDMNYEDPTLYHYSRAWEHESDEFTGGRPGIPVVPHRMRVPINDLQFSDKYATLVRFASDANSGGVAIMCKLAEILVAPDNSITEVSSVKDADGKTLISHALNTWCAST